MRASRPRCASVGGPRAGAQDGRPPFGEPKNVVLQAEGGGTETVTGQYFPYDHLPGGVLMWKKPAYFAPAVSIDLGGKIATIAH